MYYDLFKSRVEGFKETGNGQFVGRCPYPEHTDNKASFCGNHHSGLFDCKGCGVQGNAPQFATDMGVPNPKQYYTNNYNGVATITPKKVNIDKVDVNKMEQYKQHLKDNISQVEYFGLIWDSVLIDAINIGMDKWRNLKFGYADSSNKLVAIKSHKKGIEGKRKAQWYPYNKIAEYSPKKPLYIAEGEIDVITLISNRFQAITGTTGCNSIPKDRDGNYDVKWLGIFIEIIICYDNDEAGSVGLKKARKTCLAKNIKDIYTCAPPKKYKDWNDFHVSVNSRDAVYATLMGNLSKMDFGYLATSLLP